MHFGYNGQNLALWNCDCLEMLRHEDFVVRKLFKEKTTAIQEPLCLCFYVCYVCWPCILWCASVNSPSLGYSIHSPPPPPPIVLYNEGLLYLEFRSSLPHSHPAHSPIHYEEGCDRLPRKENL
jgi:hypothetical protein